MGSFIELTDAGGVVFVDVLSVAAMKGTSTGSMVYLSTGLTIEVWESPSVIHEKVVDCIKGERTKLGFEE